MDKSEKLLNSGSSEENDEKKLRDAEFNHEYFELCGALCKDLKIDLLKTHEKDLGGSSSNYSSSKALTNECDKIDIDLTAPPKNENKLVRFHLADDWEYKLVKDFKNLRFGGFKPNMTDRNLLNLRKLMDSSKIIRPRKFDRQSKKIIRDFFYLTFRRLEAETAPISGRLVNPNIPMIEDEDSEIS